MLVRGRGGVGRSGAGRAVTVTDSRTHFLTASLPHSVGVRPSVRPSVRPWMASLLPSHSLFVVVVDDDVVDRPSPSLPLTHSLTHSVRGREGGKL